MTSSVAATETSLVPLDSWPRVGASVSSVLGGLEPSTTPVLVRQENPVLGQQEMLKAAHTCL